MNRLPTLSPQRMVATLKKAGFVDHHQEGSHKYLWHPTRGVMTSVPMHRRDMKRGTMFKVLKEAGITQEEFRNLL